MKTRAGRVPEVQNTWAEQKMNVNHAYYIVGEYRNNTCQEKPYEEHKDVRKEKCYTQNIFISDHKIKNIVWHIYTHSDAYYTKMEHQPAYRTEH